MLIKSPLKKDKVRPNKRKKSGDTKRERKTQTQKTSRANSKVYGRRVQKEKDQKKRISLPAVKPWKVVVGAVILGILGILYLNHVFATQELLREVQQLEREYNQVRRLHSNYRLTYDRMIGPAEIYEQAKKSGFINGGPAEKVIEVEK
jgi:hypothetical protein